MGKVVDNLLIRYFKRIGIRSIILSQILLPTCGYAQGFFEQRYRGWLWFEEHQLTWQELQKIEKSGNETIEQTASNNITPVIARAEIEQFARELEELKFIMLARPTVENVRAYREKEREMWKQAEELHDSWNMANLLYPEQRDLINNPVNVHAVKIKRQLDSEANGEMIKQLAKNFDLVLFFNSSCKYCQLLTPVLKSFGQQYGFNIEAISVDGVKHEYFKTVTSSKLVEQLGITAFPTVIAISHDSKTAFELIRGYVSISELEEYSVLASKYLQAQLQGSGQVGAGSTEGQQDKRWRRVKK